MNTKIKTQVVVLGAGPAGYSAAFRCADLGLETTIIEQYNTLGGVCLNVGCIPSKALLHVAKVIKETRVLTERGIIFGRIKANIDNIRAWKEGIISQLTSGLTSMAKSRKVTVINGLGQFTGVNSLSVERKNEKIIINFDYAIIAAGSRSIQLPFVPYDDLRIWNSTDALALKEIPGHMLIVGGGIIGLEMGIIYHAFGSKIDLVEISNQVIPDADEDIIKVLTKSISKKINLMLETKVTALESKRDGIYASIEGKERSISGPRRYDVVLIAVGRTPNSKNINANKADVEIDNNGFINVDKQLRTSVPHIFAIGDIIGQPMLAHKGIHEGHVVAEIIAGMQYCCDPKAIPSVAYTEPEVAWVGITEKKAREKGINFETATFPWTFSGRAISSDCTDGVTKLIFDKDTRRIIGGATVGTNAGELLGEIGLAIEMGCDAEDIALTVHAHPTLYESVGLAAELFSGTITDLPKNNKRKSNLL